MQVSASGSMSTVSKEDNLVFSSEDSSSPDESELELGLGLSLGGGCGGLAAKERLGSMRSRCGRILTAKDFPSVVSSSVSSSLSSSASASASSSSSSSLSRASVTAGTKRSADSAAAGTGASSQVVGWPPIRAYRMNSLVNHAKSSATEVFDSMEEENRCMSNAIGKAENRDEKNASSKVKGHTRNSLFVKVNMDGIPIGRKVDLSAHSGYEALARTLEDMFNEPTTLVKLRSSGKDGPSRLLDGSSEHVLTYEDREGDWMLVGDVPWGMFLSSVKRLRIMRTSEANGLSPRLQERNGRQRRDDLH